jgi:hypothetical protein
VSSPHTPEIVRAPSLDGLVAAFRNYAQAAAAGTTPDGMPGGLPDDRVAQAYAHAAACVENHTARLLEQGTDKLNGPDLRARLLLVEAELARTRERAEMAEHRVGDAIRAALDLPPEMELGDIGVSSVIAERQKWRDDHDGACKTLAAMHAAAMGGVVRGPVRGVVEDVWALRVALEQLAQYAEQYLDTEHRSPERDAELRVRLGDASTDAALVLRPADAEEHRDPIDTVSAIRDVIECRSALARVAAELDQLPRLPAGERKAKREQLRDLCRELAGEPPYEHVQTRVEILLDLLHDGWGVIANAGVHRGSWDAEHPDWVAAAERWRDRFHQTIGLDQLVEAGLGDVIAEFPSPAAAAAAPTNTCEADADAARKWAGEVWRLESGMTELGIAVDGPVGTAAVDTALRIIAAGRQATTATPAPAPAPVDPDALALLPELAEHADDPAAVPNDALLRDMGRIAQGYRGVAYDPADRPAEILAVRRAAYRAGLVPFPSEQLAPPRGYRGATPPSPKMPAAAVVTNTTGAPLTLANEHRHLTLAPGESVTITAAPVGAVIQ